MRRGLVLAPEVWHQVDTVDVVGRLRAGQGANGRQDVERNDGRVVGLASGELAGPGDEERHADAAFERLALVAPQRPVDGRIVREERRQPGAAVIADENDERILVRAGFLQMGEDTAQYIIQAN